MQKCPANLVQVCHVGIILDFHHVWRLDFRFVGIVRVFKRDIWGWWLYKDKLCRLFFPQHRHGETNSHTRIEKIIPSGRSTWDLRCFSINFKNQMDNIWHFRTAWKLNFCSQSPRHILIRIRQSRNSLNLNAFVYLHENCFYWGTHVIKKVCRRSSLH